MAGPQQCSLRVFVGVTGAQGVGKSTFCKRLHASLQDRGIPATLLAGLGDEAKRLGVPLGSASSPDTIAAVFTAHLARERSAPCGVVLLDRCVVDALAYVRSLSLMSPLYTQLFEEISSRMARRLRLVVSLQMSGRFMSTSATHEAPGLRASVAAWIPRIIEEFEVRALSLNAAEDGAVELAAEAIIGLVQA